MMRVISLIFILLLLSFSSVEAKRNVIVNEQGDTIKYLYPKFNGITIGVDIFNPIANAFGQKFGNYEVSIDAGFYNRFYPIYEAGICYANDKPDGFNYTYHVNPSFYNRIGLNYNIMYNKKIPGIFYVGIRYGFSFSDYEIRDITATSPYWDTKIEGLTIPGGKSFSQWGEAVIGLQVRLYKGFMMGWSLRYKLLFSSQQDGDARPWIIPGFGKRNNPLGVTFTLNYRFSPKVKSVSATVGSKK
ncbi:MAG: DUF6048 family protein [Bacteroidales bacterium]